MSISSYDYTISNANAGFMDNITKGLQGSGVVGPALLAGGALILILSRLTNLKFASFGGGPLGGAILPLAGIGMMGVGGFMTYETIPKPTNQNSPLQSASPIIMVGGAATAVLGFFFGGKSWPLLMLGGLGAVAGGLYLDYNGGNLANTVGGAAGKTVGNTIGWTKDYGPYMFIAGLVMNLIFGNHSKGKTVTGPLIVLTSWGLMISGAYFTLSNFNFAKIQLPNLGQGIRTVADKFGASSGAHLAMPYIPSTSTMASKPYKPIPQPIVTGTAQNGSTNPQYDKNHIFSVIGDTY